MSTTVRLAPAYGRRRGDRGTASIEMVALFPIVAITLVLVLQVLAMAYTAHGASQAARDAARACSLGESPQAAAQASLPGAVTLVSVRTFGPDHGVSVTVQAPPILLITDRNVTRQVSMP